MTATSQFLAKGGLKAVAQGRSDIFHVNPYLLQEKTGWNSREQNADLEAHIDTLAQSIAEVGVKEPLTVVVEDSTIYVTDGHCRRLAVLRAIEVYKAEIKSVPVKTEGRYATEADRVLSQLVRNAGRPLTAFEQGKVFKKLFDLGWDEKTIAAKVGLSGTRVTQLLELQAAPDAVLALVKSGQVAATLAQQTLKANGGDAEKTIAALTGAVAVAKAKGKARATAKDAGKLSPVKALKAILTAAGDAGAVDNSDADGAVTVTFTAEQWAQVVAITKVKL